MSEHELVVVKRGELHGVLEQTGASSETGARHVGGPWVIECDRVPDAFKVEPKIVGHHEQLIGCGKFDVPPRVGEQLRQFRFLRSDLNGRRGEMPEEFVGPSDCGIVASADDLRQLKEFRHRLSFGNPFGTESNIDPVQAGACEAPFDERSDPGINR